MGYPSSPEFTYQSCLGKQCYAQPETADHRSPLHHRSERAELGHPGQAFTTRLQCEGQLGKSTMPGPNAVMSAVQSACSLVSDPSLPAQYQGELYDCAGKADTIRQQAR